MTNLILYSRQIKMSSPNLNNLIIIGSIMSYISVGVLGLDSTMTSEVIFFVYQKALMRTFHTSFLTTQ